MENFPNNLQVNSHNIDCDEKSIKLNLFILQLQKNTLLTLCSDRILQDVSFDRYRCARLVLDCLCTFEDSSMGRMSVVNRLILI